MTSSLSHRTAIPSSKPQLDVGLQHRPVSPNLELEVTLLLRGKAVADAHPLASGTLAVRDRRHLQLDEYFGEFGADPEDIDAVSRFAANHRLDVVKANRH